MRRFAYIFLLTLTACSLAVTEDYDPEVALTFNPMSTPYTKSSSEVFPSDLVFGVSAWTVGRGVDWIYGCDVKPFVHQEKGVRSSEDSWRLEKTLLWPSVNESMTVVAYAPYSRAAGCSHEYGVRFEDVDVLEDQTDLMYTLPQKDMDKVSTGGIVPLPFLHALCRVDFKVKDRTSPGEQIIVKKIVLQSASFKGSFSSLPQPQWTVGTETSPVVFFDGSLYSSDNPVMAGESLLMIPQRLRTAVEVEFEYVNAAGYSITQQISSPDMDTDLKPGKHYTYVLSVGVDDVRFMMEIL